MRVTARLLTSALSVALAIAAVGQAANGSTRGDPREVGAGVSLRASSLRAGVPVVSRLDRAAGATMAAQGDQPFTGSFRARSFPFAHVPLWRRYSPTNYHGYQNQPKDKDGVPTRDRSGIHFYSPTGVAWAGLELLARYFRLGDERDLAIVHACARKLRELLADAGNTGWLPWPVPSGGNRLDAPWYNALSQGTALALFSRLYEFEGDPADLRTAGLLFSAFEELGPGSDPWVSQVDHGYLWFEHFAGGYHEHVLNAHLWATFALYDYWLVAPSADSLRMLDGGTTTMRDEAKLFRRPGTYSWYCLIHKVAHAHYQTYHVQELRALAIESRTPYFAELASQFHEDYP